MLVVFRMTSIMVEFAESKSGVIPVDRNSFISASFHFFVRVGVMFGMGFPSGPALVPASRRSRLRPPRKFRKLLPTLSLRLFVDQQTRNCL